MLKPLFYSLFCCLLSLALYAQEGIDLPSRLIYCPISELDKYVAELEPGDNLLGKSVLISNQYRYGDVSFRLSFDGRHWASFGVGPSYASFYKLNEQSECIFSITTNYGQSREKIVKRYTLFRGRCYGIFWNQEAGCWDINETHCKRTSQNQ